MRAEEDKTLSRLMESGEAGVKDWKVVFEATHTIAKALQSTCTHTIPTYCPDERYESKSFVGSRRKVDIIIMQPR